MRNRQSRYRSTKTVPFGAGYDKCQIQSVSASGYGEYKKRKVLLEDMDVETKSRNKNFHELFSNIKTLVSFQEYANTSTSSCKEDEMNFKTVFSLRKG